jgi:hypothetical protein
LNPEKTYDLAVGLKRDARRTSTRAGVKGRNTVGSKGSVRRAIGVESKYYRSLARVACGDDGPVGFNRETSYSLSCASKNNAPISKNIIESTVRGIPDQSERGVAWHRRQLRRTGLHNLAVWLECHSRPCEAARELRRDFAICAKVRIQRSSVEQSAGFQGL